MLKLSAIFVYNSTDKTTNSPNHSIQLLQRVSLWYFDHFSNLYCITLEFPSWEAYTVFGYTQTCRHISVPILPDQTNEPLHQLLTTFNNHLILLIMRYLSMFLLGWFLLCHLSTQAQNYPFLLTDRNFRADEHPTSVASAGKFTATAGIYEDDYPSKSNSWTPMDGFDSFGNSPILPPKAFNYHWQPTSYPACISYAVWRANNNKRPPSSFVKRNNTT